MLRNDIWEQGFYGGRDPSAYGGSTIDTQLNTTYVGLLDADLRSHVKAVKIESDGGTIQRSAFALSTAELGGNDAPLDGSTYIEEGNALAYLVSGNRQARIALYDGVPNLWYLRTRLRTSKGLYYAFVVSTAGGTTYGQASSTWGYRPAFCLEDTMLFRAAPNADGSYSPLGSPYAD